MSGLTVRNNEQQGATNAERLLLGDSQPMRDLKDEILLAARDDITVLITGESGVGKELVARAVHRKSKRAGGPFLAVNCGSLTESLLASELFGHVRGAFTGAAGPQSGLFEAAKGGTILLDEIGDMPLQMQVYLLRVLQERTIVPVGSRTEKIVDVRVIAATNKYLPLEVREGRFRQDLYYRLSEFPIRVPALRERPSDIPLLVRRFLGEAEVEEGALDLLCGYHWPGNIRELKAAAKILGLRAAAGVITADQVRREIRLREKMAAEAATADSHREKRQDVITYAGELRIGDSVDEHFDRQKLAIYKVLVRDAGSYSDAAKRLGLKPQALHNRMRRLRR